MAYTIIAIGLICAAIFYVPSFAIGYLIGFFVGYKYKDIDNWTKKLVREAEEENNKNNDL